MPPGQLEPEADHGTARAATVTTPEDHGPAVLADRLHGDRQHADGRGQVADVRRELGGPLPAEHAAEPGHRAHAPSAARGSRPAWSSQARPRAPAHGDDERAQRDQRGVPDRDQRELAERRVEGVEHGTIIVQPSPGARPDPSAASRTAATSSPGCAPPAACSPRRRPRCCSPRRATPADARARWWPRRVAGVPLEQVVGWAEFCGLRVAVAPGRVRAAAAHRAAGRAGRGACGGPVPVVLDLCCGTGALGAAVAARVPGLEVWAGDVDPAAVACARRNLPPDRVLEGDLYDALPADLRGRVDVAGRQRAVRADRRDRR